MAFKTIHAPHILLPKSSVDMNSYAVIACDQYTSQKNYWDELKQMIGLKPSTFNMIFPEAYLEHVNKNEYINNINSNICNYLNNGILVDHGPCFVLVERTTSYGTRRLGIVLSVDLEDYSFELGTKCNIKASEATIKERIPPRLIIRKDAPLELPHIMLLFDDEQKTIIEPLYKNREMLPILYDFDLNQNGGHIKGYRIDDTNKIISLFEQLYHRNNNGLIFIVGDGNHSLATAKEHWDNLKSSLTIEEREEHPARYALVEANNVYDDGINFEPIHRILFKVKDDFYKGLLDVCKGENESCYVFNKKYGKTSLKTPKNAADTYKLIQTYLDDYLMNHKDVSIDFIHDEESLLGIVNSNNDAVAICMPAIGKSDIFSFVSKDEVLPRKSFSMGHASEKRYYIEAKKI